jgi:hypothetical protein
MKDKPKSARELRKERERERTELQTVNPDALTYQTAKQWVGWLHPANRPRRSITD